MEIRSFYALFLCSLLVVSSFLQSNGLSSVGTTGKCEPRDCSEPGRFRGDNKFPCLIGYQNECDRFNVQPVGKPKKNIVLPRIAAVNVYQRPYPEYNRSYPVMNVTLSLPNDAGNDLVKALSLELANYCMSKIEINLSLKKYPEENCTFCGGVRWEGMKINSIVIGCVISTVDCCRKVHASRIIAYTRDYSLKRTKAVELSIRAITQPNYRFCRLFDFRNATFTEKDVEHPRLLTYPCFSGLEEQLAAVFHLSVTALPDKLKVEYYATVQTHEGKWKSSLLVWQPSGKKVLRVMFERNESITEYKLTLYNYDKHNTSCGNPGLSKEVQTKLVQDGSNTVNFDAEDNSRYMYFITIIPLNCGSNCDSTTSYCMSLKNQPHVSVNIVSGPGNDRATKTVLGVICGVVTGGLLVVFLTYLYKKKPICDKRETTVLLLYSADCTNHKNVVERLALVLRKTFDCNVHFDLFELRFIEQMNLLTWLQEKIDMSDFIVFVCSTGGRLQCNPNIKRMQFNESHPIENYFCAAVEKVTSIWREFKVQQESIAVITMSYSNNGDIPAKLDCFRKFEIKHCKDLVPLYCYLKRTDKMPDSLQSSEDVKSFFSALQEANTFFEKNPDWIYKFLDKSYVDNKTPALSAKRCKKAMTGPRLNNADVDQHCGLSDWCLSQDKVIGNQWSSQPNSIHSSESSCRYKMVSSRSLECLSKKTDDLEMGASLLNKPCLRSDRIDSEDSDAEETRSNNICASVDFHLVRHGSYSDSVGAHEYNSDSEGSDLLKNIENIHHGPNTEKIRKFVSPLYNDTPHPPVCPWPPGENHINSIPMVLCSPSEIHSHDPDNTCVYIETDMCDHLC